MKSGSQNLTPEEQKARWIKNRKLQIREQIKRLADKIQEKSAKFLHCHDLSHGNKGMGALAAEAKMSKRSIMATRKKIYKLEQELKSL